MPTRKTDVSWDANLVRVEYLDDKGDPYYCSFDTRGNTPECKAASPSGASAVVGSNAAEALAGALTVVAVGMLLKALAGLLEKNGSKKGDGY
jgi:hypothetical protein